MTGFIQKGMNFINIEDYTPKEDLQSRSANNGKKKSTKSMKSSHTGDFLDERRQQDEDADDVLALAPE